MAQYRERRWPKIVIGYAVLLVVLAAVTAFAYDAAAPANQPMVLRLTVAFLVAVALIHVRSYRRGDPLWDPPSEFQNALVPPPPTGKLDPGFVRLREEVANSAASRSYFENILRPRLGALARHRHGDDADLPVPAAGALPRRGPSRRDLETLIEHLEKQP
jgi:hypothetical protein